jgi:hypothetical protein
MENIPSAEEAAILYPLTSDDTGLSLDVTDASQASDHIPITATLF